YGDRTHASTADAALAHLARQHAPAPTAAAGVAQRWGSPEWLSSMTGPSSRAVSAPWGASWTPPAVWLMACAAPAESVPYASPASIAAALMWLRASRLLACEKATRRYLATYSIASSATASVYGWW